MSVYHRRIFVLTKTSPNAVHPSTELRTPKTACESNRSQVRLSYVHVDNVNLGHGTYEIRQIRLISSGELCSGQMLRPRIARLVETRADILLADDTKNNNDYDRGSNAICSLTHHLHYVFFSLLSSQTLTTYVEIIFLA